MVCLKWAKHIEQGFYVVLLKAVTSLCACYILKQEKREASKAFYYFFEYAILKTEPIESVSKIYVTG